MRVVCDGGRWRIEGQGRERARLAFATLAGRELTFTIEEQTSPLLTGIGAELPNQC